MGTTNDFILSVCACVVLGNMQLEEIYHQRCRNIVHKMDASIFFYMSSFEIIGKFAKSVIGQYVE